LDFFDLLLLFGLTGFLKIADYSSAPILMYSAQVVHFVVCAAAYGTVFKIRPCFIGSMQLGSAGLENTPKARNRRSWASSWELY